MTFGSSGCFPPTRPSFRNAMTNRARSVVLEKIEPAGHDAALSAAGRAMCGAPPAASCPCASGHVIAMVGRSVVRCIPSGWNTRSSMASA